MEREAALPATATYGRETGRKYTQQITVTVVG